MIEGIALLIVGTLVMFAAPAHDLIAHRRHHGRDLVGRLLEEAFPVPLADRALEHLVEAADAALERDALIRGVRGLTAIYGTRPGT